MDNNNNLKLLTELASKDVFIKICNSRISYSNEDLLHIDDDIVSAFSFQILHLMYVPIESTFGFISSPSNFKPLARVRVWLAKYISRDNTLVKKHWNIINHLNFCKRLDKK